MSRQELKQEIISWVESKFAGKPSFVVKDAVVRVLEAIKKCTFCPETEIPFQAEMLFSTAQDKDKFTEFATAYVAIVNAEAQAEYEAEQQSQQAQELNYQERFIDGPRSVKPVKKVVRRQVSGVSLNPVTDYVSGVGL